MKFKPVTLVLITVLVVSFLISKIPGPFKYLSYPYDIISLWTSRAGHGVGELFKTVRLTKEKVDFLENQINELTGRLIEYENIKRENLLLKELLGLKDRGKRIVSFSRVIRRGLQRWSNAIIIDKGEVEGVRKDMAVITPKGLVGKVVQANRDFSEVLLLDDPDFRVAVRFLTSRVEGIATGTGREVIVRYVPLEAEITKDDWVITSGLDGIFPEGILVGYVTGVKNRELFKEVLIKTVENLRSLEFVAVVSRGQK